MIGLTLTEIVQTCHRPPMVRKDALSPGDWLIIRTVGSEYRLRVLGGGIYEATGGWFDKKGFSPMKIGVSGATWGGSVIMPRVLAACDMCIEFRNRLITSPVRKIVVFPGRVGN